MKNFKKISCLLLFVCGLLLCGCTSKRYYSITYFIDNNVVTLEPEGYYSGSETILPSVDVSQMENKEFSGWYSNAQYTGDCITKISKSEIGDKVFFGKLVDVTTPDPTPDPASNISKIYAASSGEEVKLSGKITGTYGNNFYVSDGIKGILVYMGTNSNYGSLIKVGANVDISGTVDIYKDVHQIKNVTNITASTSDYTVTSKDLISVTQDVLKTLINDSVNLTNAKAVDVPTYVSGSDYSFKVQLAGNEVDIFMSRHVSESKKDEIMNVLNTVSTNDAITINNVHVAKYTLYQLAITNETVITKTSSSTDTPVAVDLDKVFNQTSYRFTLGYSYDGENYEEEYSVDNDKYYDCVSEVYYAIINGLTYVYYQEDDAYYYLTEEDNEYVYYDGYLFFADISLVDTTKLVQKNGYYTCIDSYLDEFGLILTGYDDTFKSAKIYITDNKLTKIELTSQVTDDYGTFDFSYTLEFSNFGNEKVNLPTDAIHIDGSSNGDSFDTTTAISDVYSMSSGDSVSIEGVITGVYGNNFYICDGTKSILVYLGNSSDFSDLIEIGSAVSVSGTVDIYKDVHQIKSVTSMFANSNTYVCEEIVLNDVKQSTLKEYVNDYISVYDLEIKQLNSISKDKDYTFTCLLDGVEVNIFISRHNASNRDPWFNTIEGLSVGDKISLTGVNVSKYSAYQLVLSSSSEILTSSQEVVSRGIICSPTTLTVTQNITLSDILDEIKVYEKFSNGTKTELTSSDYILNDGGYKVGDVGKYTFTFTYNSYQVTCTVVVKAEAQASFKAEITASPMLEVKDKMGYDKETNTTYGVTIGLPSIGNPKVLVIPVEFTDYPADKTMKSSLEKALFGASEDTGWESLKTYYNKSSYGKLNIDGTVLEPFNTGKSTSYYNNLYKQYLNDLEKYNNYETDEYPDNVEYQIIKDALDYYDDQINYKDYDYNGDGYIDSIYLIYTCPYDNTSDDSLWWAYTTEYYSENVEMHDGVEADYYLFMSYEFFNDDFYGNTVTYNTETVIHETGHLLGLDDYYDYDSTQGPDGGLGGGDMMDYNVGDHNPYSKLMLGWISPTVVTGKTETFTISSFASSQDAIFIFKDYQGSFFSEYYIIDFYTPTGLNKAQSGNSGLFSTSGIRIYHVDAALNSAEDCYSIFDITKYNNSYSQHKLISLVEADGKNDILKGDLSSNSDLFKVNSTYSNSKWYDNSSTNFTVKVDAINENNATITITFK